MPPPTLLLQTPLLLLQPQQPQPPLQLQFQASKIGLLVHSVQLTHYKELPLLTPLNLSLLISLLNNQPLQNFPILGLVKVPLRTLTQPLLNTLPPMFLVPPRFHKSVEPVTASL